jgi:energy-coupling factor transporter transmembrane protein EcfT
MMTDRVFLQYRHSESLLHSMDARFKLLAMILLCVSIFAAGPISLAGLTLLTVILLRACGIRAARLIRDLKPLFVLMLFVVLARTLTGSGAVWLDLGWLRLSKPGLEAGLLAGWRLLIVALLSSLLISTTRLSHMRSAIARIGRPLPFLPAARLATMFGLTLGFVPLILLEAGEVLEAQKARCVESRRNPLLRVYSFVVVLLRKVFLRGDHLALAMEARCYSDQAALPALEACAADWLKLGSVILIVAPILLFRL